MGGHELAVSSNTALQKFTFFPTEKVDIMLHSMLPKTAFFFDQWIVLFFAVIKKPYLSFIVMFCEF